VGVVVGVAGGGCGLSEGLLVDGCGTVVQGGEDMVFAEGVDVSGGAVEGDGGRAVEAVTVGDAAAGDVGEVEGEDVVAEASEDPLDGSCEAYVFAPPAHGA